MRLTDSLKAELYDDLRSYRSDFGPTEIRAGLIASTFPRLLATVAMMPEELREADILELGAAPFFLTLWLRRLCAGRLALASYFGNDEQHLTSRLTDARNGAEQVFELDLFNIETQEFPYRDASFGAVIFGELIEHLALNPVHALAEMHRVLKPGGFLIVTTPNRYSMLRQEAFLRGIPQMVDRYAPAYGYGVRHNREYGPDELVRLLEGTGFAVEEIAVRDLALVPLTRRIHRQVWRVLLRLYSDLPREEHVFIRARRRDPFRWNFPPWLFDNMEMYSQVRESWLQMGINDAIQCTDGWQQVEQDPTGVSVRWTHSLARGFLRMPAGRPIFRIECFAAGAEAAPPLCVKLTVSDRWFGRSNSEYVYICEPLFVERGRWQHIDCRLRSYPAAGTELEVLLEIDSAETDASSPAGPPETHRGLAVARYELTPIRCEEHTAP